MPTKLTPDTIDLLRRIIEQPSLALARELEVHLIANCCDGKQSSGLKMEFQEEKGVLFALMHVKRLDISGYSKGKYPHSSHRRRTLMSQTLKKINGCASGF